MEIPVPSRRFGGQHPRLQVGAKRDGKAAAQFFRTVLGAEHTQTPRVITVDKNAAYPVAVDELKQDQTLKAQTERSAAAPVFEQPR